MDLYQSILSYLWWKRYYKVAILEGNVVEFIDQYGLFLDDAKEFGKFGVALVDVENGSTVGASRE